MCGSLAFCLSFLRVPLESPSQFVFTRKLQGGYHVHCLFAMESGDAFAESSAGGGIRLCHQREKFVPPAQSPGNDASRNVM